MCTKWTHTGLVVSVGPRVSFSSVILNLGIRWWVVSFASPPLYPRGRGERATSTHWIGRWVGPGTFLDVMEQRKIFCPFLESNSDSSGIQPVAFRHIVYTRSVHSLRNIFWWLEDYTDFRKLCWAKYGRLFTS
jgi:hypothetical protein